MGNCVCLTLYLDENTLVVVPRTDWVPFIHRLEFDLPPIKQQIATMTAIKNIVPNIQKAKANFDDDKHNMPSDRAVRSLVDAYSSTNDYGIMNECDLTIRQNFRNVFLTSSIESSIQFDLRCRYGQWIEHFDAC